MKKIVILFIVAVLFCLSACDDSKDKSVNNLPTESTSKPTSDTTEPTTNTIQVEPGQLPLPADSVDFSFSSGAGAWATTITVNRDGTFTGQYLDSDMGITGEDYPYGSASISVFSGRFENIEKVNDYSYRMTLADLATETPVDQEWIEDGIRFIATAPNGLVDINGAKECTDFIFYTPDIPIDQVPKGFLSWWPYRYRQEINPKTTLSCYGILNVATDDGFFYWENEA